MEGHRTKDLAKEIYNITKEMLITLEPVITGDVHIIMLMVRSKSKLINILPTLKSIYLSKNIEASNIEEEFTEALYDFTESIHSIALLLEFIPGDIAGEARNKLHNEILNDTYYHVLQELVGN